MGFKDELKEAEKDFEENPFLYDAPFPKYNPPPVPGPKLSPKGNSLPLPKKIPNAYSATKRALSAMIFLGMILCLGNCREKCDSDSDMRMQRMQLADNEISQTYGDPDGTDKTAPFIDSIRNHKREEILRGSNGFFIWSSIVAMIQCVGVFAICMVGKAIIGIAERANDGFSP